MYTLFWYVTDDETTCSSEVGHLIEIQLCDIPQVLIYNDLTYEL